MSAFKSRDEIERVLMSLPGGGDTKYPGMNYEQGIEEALMWVLGDIGGDEFSYAPEAIK
jgi:hypothetical protein